MLASYFDLAAPRGRALFSHCAAVEASRVRRRSRSCNRKSTWQETSPLERAQLMQTGEESGTDFSQLRPGRSYDASGSLSRVGTGVSPSVDEQLQGLQTGESGSAGTGGKRDPQSAMLGLLMNGVGVGGGVGGAFGENVISLFETDRMNGFVASQGPSAISSLPATPAESAKRASPTGRHDSQGHSVQTDSFARRHVHAASALPIDSQAIRDRCLRKRSTGFPVDSDRFFGRGPNWFRLAELEEME
jgi:hypothetical protein